MSASVESNIVAHPVLPIDYLDDMRTLRARLTAMSSRCREQLHLALDAFHTGSNEKVPLIEDLDRAVDEDEVSIDELVLRILAVRHPVASDLRLVVASFRIVTDLERIGDEAVEIGRQPPIAEPEGETQRRRLRAMGDGAEALFADAMHAFFEGDEHRARQIRHRADSIAALHVDAIREAAVVLAQKSTDAGGTMSVLSVARCLDRIAAHAVNIGRAAVFVAGRGDMPR